MRAGRMTRRLTLQYATDVRDAGGGNTRSWAAGAVNRRGRIRPLSGTELYEAQQVEARATVEITVRYHSALTPAYRIVDRDSSKVYEVVHVLDPEERHHEMRCLCTEAD